VTVGQWVFGLADCTRDGSLAEYTAVEARNLAPLPADIDYTAAAVPISGLTSWQGLFDHAGLKTGQTVLIHGAAGGGPVPGAESDGASRCRLPSRTRLKLSVRWY
jgi:NADPH:quinone reductase-like Zn-dependent oxidoreductase